MTNDEVRQIRERLGWSQKRLAEFLGVSQPTVFRIENDQPVPGPIERLLRQVSVSAEQEARTS
ncbi:helix-turn-helix domain-containing protein [Kaistia algarum]|uniref:helix-turn-helix domain-containing protein n=1 Tax=Kaistia algarum TaxID=2083279 RepID=UPI00140333D7|nr:helix-turn-helix transcriptional regulator [Kaistia algarum]MCX5516202.1 helix-turn-helix transcriptional regulator [Kaistia algarum]